MGQIKQIIKRDGRRVPFDEKKIANAIYAAAHVLGGQDRTSQDHLAKEVGAYLTYNLEIT